MRPDVTRGASRAAWAAAALWVGYAALIVVGAAMSQGSQSVVHHYRRASLAWLAGDPIYSGTEHGFLYLPAFAVLHVPFALPPFDVGAGAWRLVNLALLAGGLLHLVRAAEPGLRGRLFLVATACVLPLAWASARHGQSTLAMAGAMLAGAGEVARGRFARVAPWAAGALVAKPVGIVFVLLAGATHRRLLLPLLAAVGAALALPFLAQAPGYVAEQHADLLRTLRLAGDPSETLRYPDLPTALRSLGASLPPAATLALRAAAAAATLVLWLRLRRRLPAYAQGLVLYALAACYLVLFNPRTEHNAYSLVAPALGLFAGHAWLVLGRPRLALAYGLLAFAIGQERDLLRPLSGGNPSWLRPLLTLVFLALAALHLRDRPGPRPVEPA